MALPARTFVRLPRFRVAEKASGHFFLVRDRTPNQRYPVQLLDFSRHGSGARLNLPLDTGELVTLVIEDDNGRFKASLPGRVRWVVPEEEEGVWMFGCLFAETVSWEICGELFLRGFVTAEEPETFSAPSLSLSPRR